MSESEEERTAKTPVCSLYYITTYGNLKLNYVQQSEGYKLSLPHFAH